MPSNIREKRATLNYPKPQPVLSHKQSSQSKSTTAGGSHSHSTLSQETSPTHPFGKGLKKSSIASDSRDSDVWHSESEANWTIMDAYSIHNKDIEHSQVLSSESFSEHQTIRNEQPCRTAVPDENPGKHPAASHRTISVGSSVADVLSAPGNDDDFHGFEPPHLSEAFGCCSWNALCLARNVNYVNEGECSLLINSILGLQPGVFNGFIACLS